LRFVAARIFSEMVSGNGSLPSATPQELATAIIEVIHAGVRVINLSSALAQSSPKGENKLGEALNYAAHHGSIIVAAAGNQGTGGSSAITPHALVVPVVSWGGKGLPTRELKPEGPIGKTGPKAPGQNITSLGTNGKPL